MNEISIDFMKFNSKGWASKIILWTLWRYISTRPTFFGIFSFLLQQME